MKQATYGDGSLYQRKDGRWEYRVRIGTKSSGDPDYKSFYSRDKTGRAAKKQFIDWQRERDQQKIEVNQTVASWAERWLTTYKQGRGTSGGNYKNYCVYVENHIVPHIGNLMMGDVRQAHIEQIYRSEAKLSNSALNYIKLCLRGIFKSGLKNHLCTEDPTEDTAPVWHASKSPEYFSREEMEYLLEFIPRDKDGYLAEGLLYTGLRIGEACALTWDDYGGSTLLVHRNAARTDERGMKYFIKECPKGKKPREVVLDPSGVALFERLPHTSKWIFAGDGSNFMSPDLYRRRYYRFIDRLNASLAAKWVQQGNHKENEKPPYVRKLSPHKCRHTYGSYLLEGCHNLRTVQDQLGHSRVTTTEIYTHSDIKSRKVDVSKLKF